MLINLIDLNTFNQLHEVTSQKNTFHKGNSKMLTDKKIPSLTKTNPLFNKTFSRLAQINTEAHGLNILFGLKMSILMIKSGVTSQSSIKQINPYKKLFYLELNLINMLK